MYFSRIKYLGGLPYPFDSIGNIDIAINYPSQQLIFRQSGGKVICLMKTDVSSVTTDIKQDRSIGQGVVGYVVGNMLARTTGGLIGAAIGARRKDVSMVYINYVWNNRQNTIVLNAGKKAWEIYAAVNSFII